MNQELEQFMTVELDSFAKWEIEQQPDAMLMHNIRCMENVLDNPGQFPNARVEQLNARWVYSVAIAVSRALPEILKP